MVSGRGQHDILSQALELSPVTKVMFSSTSLSRSVMSRCYTSFLQAMGIIGQSRTILRPYNFEVPCAKCVIVPEKPDVSSREYRS